MGEFFLNFLTSKSVSSSYIALLFRASICKSVISFDFLIPMLLSFNLRYSMIKKTEVKFSLPFLEIFKQSSSCSIFVFSNLLLYSSI